MDSFSFCFEELPPSWCGDFCFLLLGSMRAVWRPGRPVLVIAVAFQAMRLECGGSAWQVEASALALLSRPSSELSQGPVGCFCSLLAIQRALWASGGPLAHTSWHRLSKRLCRLLEALWHAPPRGREPLALRKNSF